MYIDSNNRLQTTLYKKPTDCQIHLHSKSAHPFSHKKVSRIVRYLELSAYVQIYLHAKSAHLRGIQETFQDLIKRFVEKSYNESTVRKQTERVNHLDRSLLLKHCKSKRKDTISFSVTYNPVLPNIKEIINKHRHILSIDSSFKEIFKLKTTYRNTHNKKQPKISPTYTNNNHRSMYLMLHQSITLLPTSSQSNNIYKHSNQRGLYNFSPSHLP